LAGRHRRLIIFGAQCSGNTTHNFGFYLAIATDKTVEVAFNYGIDKIKHKGLDGADIPILVKGVAKN